MNPCQTVFLAAGAFAVSILAGCGGSSGSSSAPLITPQPRSVSQALPNGLTATFSEDTDAITQTTQTIGLAANSNSVTFTITLTNPTTRPVTMQFLGCDTSFDPNSLNAGLTITDSNGFRFYPSVTENPPPPCDTSLPPITQTLAPGQTLTKTQVFSKGYAAQTFTGKGVFTLNALVSTGDGASNPATIGPLPLTVQ